MRATSVMLLLCSVGCNVVDEPCADGECNATSQEVIGHHPTLSMAVIGDVPYGDPEVAQFPSLIDAINADPTVRMVVHVGDIKNGSSVCSDAYFAMISQRFADFTKPLVYTPGDNEWTDCHRIKAGKFDPLERLAAVRDTFFPLPGVTLGKPRLVFAQSWFPWWPEMVENVSWIDAGVVFATLHVVGSNNDLVPWFTDDTTDALIDDPARRLAEYDERDDANLAWLRLTFDSARATHAPGVVIFMQADMWDAASITNHLPLDGFDRLVRRIATLAADYGKPVLLVQGDSHTFLADHPLAAGDPIHGVTRHVPNLTRIVVHGETLPFEYLRLTIDPSDPDVFSWQRVPVL